MNTKDVGTLGEHIAIAELLKHEIAISRPLGDNSQYDLILDVRGFLLKAQVKSKTTGNEEKVEFSLHTTNRSGDRVRYTEVDCFVLVDIVNNKVFLLSNFDDRVSICIRYKIPENSRNNTNIHLYTEYSIEKFLESCP